jgi:putative flippase GtrA
MHPKYGELFRFALSGGATTIVNLLFYLPCYYLVFTPIVSKEAASALSNGIAWFFAVLFAFFVTKHLVFMSKEKERTRVLFELLSFYATRAFSGVFEIFLPALLIYCGVHNLVAKLAVSAFVIVCNFLTSKFITFRKKKKD